ncbi:MAG: ATP-dependent DNA helicase RecQ [Bacteroidota bacterium]|nr:ATP-dependent DNA helicase RecQ [Bacteroidota bacterium]
MSIYKEILKKYWGYPDFRPLQEDIIKSVADEGKDTLGLLPTGGGKSIIFQIPALAKKGVCVVVSPLIALMKDQVENLKKRNIAAAAIYTGITKNEILNIFEKVINGELKFLYLSPERLGTELFLTNLPQMKVSMLAIDEAHCISQWGYDFRPSYLKIAKIKPLLPNVPILALTATATIEVVDDIQNKLLFKEKNVFRKSFERKNLIYIVRKTNNKYGQLLKLISAIKGTGIVYVRSRKLTQKIAEFLSSHGISADFYHAGLDPKTKDRKQFEWKHDKTRVIVSTNAFGMGIDKSDVRFVIHIDLPDSLEAYFQEAGRGGRDEKDAYAFLLFNDEDINNLKESVEKSFPSKQTIFSVYEALCNYLRIPVGGGKNQSYEFVLSKFSQNFNFKPLEVFNSLKFIQKEGILEYTNEFFVKSKLRLTANKEELYKFQVERPKYDSFVKFLLRTYSGLFSSYVTIDEYRLSRAAKVEPKIIFNYLENLHKLKIVDYIPQRTTPYVTFIEERLHPKSFRISKENYEFLKNNYKNRIKAVIDYAEKDNECRSRLLLKYFGETNTHDCGRCDVCHSNSKNIDKQVKETENLIIKTIKENSYTINELVDSINKNPKIIQKAISNLLDNDFIYLTPERKLATTIKN